MRGVKQQYVFEDDYLKAEGGFLGVNKNVWWAIGGVVALVIGGIIYKVSKKK